MKSDWTEWIALGIVAAAAAFLVWRWLKPKKKSCCDTQCSALRKPPEDPKK